MNRILLLFSLALIFSTTVDAKKLDGIIIYENDDTVNVTFIVKNLIKLQNKVRFIDSKGEKRFLNPGEAKEIQFSRDGKFYRLLSITWEATSLRKKILNQEEKYFLPLEIDGDLRLLRYYYVTSDNMEGLIAIPKSETKMKWICQRPDGKCISINYYENDYQFKEEMITFLHDCPSIVEKIETNKFNHNDSREIVEFYNSECAE